MFKASMNGRLRAVAAIGLFFLGLTLRFPRI